MKILVPFFWFLKLAVCLVASSLAALAELEWKQPAQDGNSFGVARLTSDPTVRDWGNYHNAQNWSHDGRYVAYTHYASDGERMGRRPEVHVIDLHSGEDKQVGPGASPRWANQSNWLFYTRDIRDTVSEPRTEVRWLDMQSGKDVLVGTGMTSLGGVSMDDQWLLGGSNQTGDPAIRSFSMRMRIKENSLAEYIPGLDAGSQWIPNPVYDVVFTRIPNRDDEPFYPTRYWYRTDGSHIQTGSVTLTRCHQSWTGDGKYFLLGNSQVRGRLWNQPFPSSLHFLAAVGTGDISPCGRSGRFVVGDKPLTMADLRSGDGWAFLEDLSIICYPDNVSDDSGPYDSDMKGSPDGTKVNFVSNYDLIEGPVTRITATGGKNADRLEVESTERFPSKGMLVVNREVLAYEHKTGSSFEGLSRAVYQTLPSNLRKGDPVTSFESRCIPETQWKILPLPSASIERSMGGLDTPLVRQNSTDLWAAVVRLPDRPWLRLKDGLLQLVPGESHYETRGYKLLRNGQFLAWVRPGESLDLQPGQYKVHAVEWCGLESQASASVTLKEPSNLLVLYDKPADFSWTVDEWSIDGQRVDHEEAFASSRALREIVHLYDGIIAREWFRWGEIQRRHDLNEEGKAIRRQDFHQGRLFKREYHNREGQHISTEYLDAAGNVSEMIRYQYVDEGEDAQADMGRYATGVASGQQIEFDHWWYEAGMPMKRIGMAPARRIESKTPAMYLKSGQEWVPQPYVGKLIQKNKKVEGYSHDQQRAEEFQKRSTIK